MNSTMQRTGSNSRMNYMNNGTLDSPRRSDVRLEQMPITLKPTNTPTDKENFETELISKSYAFLG